MSFAMIVNVLLDASVAFSLSLSLLTCPCTCKLNWCFPAWRMKHIEGLSPSPAYTFQTGSYWSGDPAEPHTNTAAYVPSAKHRSLVTVENTHATATKYYRESQVRSAIWFPKACVGQGPAAMAPPLCAPSEPGPGTVKHYQDLQACRAR